MRELVSSTILDRNLGRGHTHPVPSTLRARVALFLLIGAFLIPVVLTTLRGLTHVLTCEETVREPFAFQIVPGADPIQISTGLIRRGEPETLCGGLSVQLSARSRDQHTIALQVPITNESPHPWNGTVLLQLGGTSLPVDIGSVEPGGTESDTLLLDLDPGMHELSGSLLIGP